MRAGGQLTEVRAADLRFVTDEAEALLAAFGMRDVGAAQVESLVERTEGWAAGLQLACITIGGDGPGVRLDDVVGSLRPFTDYLITEVVDVQPDEMRDFLFATSILDRVSPAVAIAVSGRRDADALLRQAERRGLFLTALDGSDEWYRYHHLFAQALQHEFRVRFPDAASAAHSAAAAWFEEHGDAGAALEHWLAAGRPDEALRLAVQVGFSLVDQGQAVTLERIARRIPATVPGDDPARQLDYGLIHIVFEPETFLAWVDEASRTIEQQAVPDDDLHIRHVMVQAIAAIIVGAWDDAVDCIAEAATRARALGSFSPYSQRAGLELIRAAGWSERLDEAEAAFRSYVADRRVPDASRLLVAPSAWALGAAFGGRIDEADHWVQRVTANADTHGFHGIFSIQEMLLAQAIVARERCDADAAIESIARIPRDRHRLVLLATGDGRSRRRARPPRRRTPRRRDHRPRRRTTCAARCRARGGRARPRRRLHRPCAWLPGDLVGARRAAERMPAGLWRHVVCARILLADGASAEAEQTLRAVSPTTPRQHVTVHVLLARGRRSRRPRRRRAVRLRRPDRRRPRLAEHRDQRRPRRRRADREGELGGTGQLGGAGPIGPRRGAGPRRGRERRESRRAADRTRADGAAVARQPAHGPGDRPRAGCVTEHPQVPHQGPLPQARRYLAA